MKKIVFVLLFACAFATGPTFACWNNVRSPPAEGCALHFAVGQFAINFGCPADLVIDEAFYHEYMVLVNGAYEWKTDQNGNVQNMQTIALLTPYGTIIKADICYMVVATSYNLIWHGLPSQSNPLPWALTPIKLGYVDGWAYSKNRVVLAEDGCFYQARYYVDGNPALNREGWDKVEPVIASDFEPIENKNVPNYGLPKQGCVKRAYVWDEYTTYQKNDIVMFENIEYCAKKSSNGAIPTQNGWAWDSVWKHPPQTK